MVGGRSFAHQHGCQNVWRFSELWTTVALAFIDILTWNLQRTFKMEKCLENLYFESLSEKLNLHLCRNILGLSKKSSSLTVLGEIGQFPIEILCFAKMIKYWHPLKTKLGNKFLIHSFLNLAETDEQKGYINWQSIVKFILKFCNLERVWLNPNAISTGKLARQCKKVLQDEFIKFFKDKLSDPIFSNVTCNIMNNQALTISRGGNKLRTYNSIKLRFSIEPYLLIIKDKEVRRSTGWPKKSTPVWSSVKWTTKEELSKFRQFWITNELT